MGGVIKVLLPCSPPIKNKTNCYLWRNRIMANKFRFKEYEYNPNKNSWDSESAEKVYDTGLKYKNDWCTLSLYGDEYENLVGYLLDDKKFYFEKKYSSKLGYDVFVSEKLDLYVVIMNETTYGFFDERHFADKFGENLGIETTGDIVLEILESILWDIFDLSKNDIDLLEVYDDFIGLRTKEPIDIGRLDKVLNHELERYKRYPISIAVEETKDCNYLIWIY